MTPEQVAARLAAAELELELKGASPADARAATRRAAGYAGAMVEHVRPELRGAVFEDLLQGQLAGAEAWLQGVRRARESGDYEEGMKRAVRDARWERGLSRAGVEPGPERTQAWRDSLAGAAEAWGE